MQRAVISTTSGCAGLGLLHDHSVWVADTPEAFAAGIATLTTTPTGWEHMARAKRLGRWRAGISTKRDRRTAARTAVERAEISSGVEAACATQERAVMRRREPRCRPWRRHQCAEQSVRFVVWAGREVEGVQAGLRAVTETESPQAVDRENGAVRGRPGQRLNERHRWPDQAMDQQPSTKFPTSRSPPRSPKPAGASASPQGELRAPPGFTRRRRKLPCVSKASTLPVPGFGMDTAFGGVLQSRRSRRSGRRGSSR